MAHSTAAAPADEDGWAPAVVGLGVHGPHAPEGHSVSAFAAARADAGGVPDGGVVLCRVTGGGAQGHAAEEADTAEQGNVDRHG